MKIVIDANVIFSALIRANVAYQCICNTTFELLAPEFIFSEIEKYKDEICRKSHKAESDLIRLFEVLKARIKIVELEELLAFVNEAERISPDPKDMIYFALALKEHCGIWSNDKRLKNQNIVHIYHTHDLIWHLYKNEG